MQDTQGASRVREWILAEVARADAAADSEGRPGRSLEVVIGNAHLPVVVSNGECYIQAPLADVFEAFGEDISAFIGDLEIRISNTWSAALPLASYWCAVSGTWVAQPCVVSGSGDW